ncbi:YggT family protein [Pokkaliibacter sp. MBI-7]|uniref:YggT family protein n=1 Tax=Pokkaliibacter sp. MBI-7 TaxID=3040600 RepID=UPI002446EF0A|nr:YggT family protein [Pokkaliibacter sp. MBI-7]MDH2432873.1 YggT family protein [Pokkaliibacter sp. MBI-7]
MGNDPIYLLVSIIGGTYLSIVLLRFLLQMARADYYNPISQAIVKATQPLLAPMRRAVPSIRGLDTSSLLLALAVEVLMVLIIDFRAYGGSLPATYVVLCSLAGVVSSLLRIYFWAILISVILSWVAPNADHPGARLVMQITEPVYRLSRKVIPPLGGLDLSPILIFLVIQLAQGQVQRFVIV